MTGVTIGLGSYQSMAEKAAESFRDKSKINTVVLGRRELEKFRLRHPMWLKFYVFDLIDDDDIVYFDADTINVESIEPLRFEKCPEFVAVRDIPSGYTERDARILGFPMDKCIQAGLFIANRQNHSKFFRECRKAARHYDWLLHKYNYNEYSPDTSKIFYDQPIFNLLIYRMDLPVRFLDRRYNFVGYGHGNLWMKQRDIKVIHFAAEFRKYYERFGSLRLHQKAAEWEVDENAFSVYDGEWAHFYDGYERCRIRFRGDGTIDDWMGLNYWFLSKGGDLVISELENANFWLRLDGDEWRNDDNRIVLKRNR